jgi:hypothetical protein
MPDDQPVRRGKRTTPDDQPTPAAAAARSDDQPVRRRKRTTPDDELAPDAAAARSDDEPAPDAAAARSDDEPAPDAGATRSDDEPAPDAAAARLDSQPASESPAARFSKLLPADLTAGFLSAKAGLLAALGEPAADVPIFWTFVGILLLSPFYFYFVVKTRHYLQIAFLSATFVVFAISIADKQFSAYLTGFEALSGIAFGLTAIAIVLPILWVFLVAPIVMEHSQGEANK